MQIGGVEMETMFGGIIGVIAALAFNRIALIQVRHRTEETSKIEAVNNPALIVFWALISGILFILIFKLFDDTVKRIELAMYVSTAISIGVVDLDLKKIPNLSVLALMLVRTAAIIYELARGGSAKETLVPSLVGLAAAFILYQLPMFFGIPIGTGDVKFSSAIGYCLGAFGFLQAAIIMALGLLVFLIYLVSTKKGSIKTKVPMGPFLALGAIATILFPVFNGLSEQVFASLL